MSLQGRPSEIGVVPARFRIPWAPMVIQGQLFQPFGTDGGRGDNGAGHAKCGECGECGDESSGILIFALQAIGEFVSLSDGFWFLPPHGFPLRTTGGFGVAKIGNVSLLLWFWACPLKLQFQLVRDSL